MPFPQLTNIEDIELATSFEEDLPHLINYNAYWETTRPNILNFQEIEIRRVLLWYSFFEKHRHWGVQFLKFTMDAVIDYVYHKNLLDLDLQEVQYVFDFYNKIFSWSKPDVFIKEGFKDLFDIAVFYASRSCQTHFSLKIYFAERDNILNSQGINEMLSSVFCKYKMPKFWAANFSNMVIEEKKMVIDISNGTHPKIYYPNLSRKECSLISTLPDIVVKNEIKMTSGLLAILIKEYDNDSYLNKFYFTYLSTRSIHSLNTNIEFWRKAYHKICYLFSLRVEDFIDEEGVLHYVYHPEMIDVIDFLEREFLITNRPSDFLSWSVNRFIEEIAYWHISLYDSMEFFEGKSWRGSGVQPFSYAMENIDFYFQEIVTGIDLYEEGMYQKHCIGSYLDDLINNTYHVWSIKIKKKEEYLPYVTALLENGKVIEAKYRFNDTLSSKDEQLLIVLETAYLELQNVKLEVEEYIDDK
jgi:hypothetical protein